MLALETSLAVNFVLCHSCFYFLFHIKLISSISNSSLYLFCFLCSSILYSSLICSHLSAVCNSFSSFQRFSKVWPCFSNSPSILDVRSFTFSISLLSSSVSSCTFPFKSGISSTRVSISLHGFLILWFFLSLLSLWFLFIWYLTSWNLLQSFSYFLCLFLYLIISHLVVSLILSTFTDFNVLMFFLWWLLLQLFICF